MTPRRSVATALAVAWDVAALPVLAPALAAQRRGDGRVVLVVPGWRTSDAATVALRSYLRCLGYRAEGWHHGANHGGSDAADAATTRVVELAERSGRQVSVVGWSLGGVVAWDVARRRPDLIDRVVTLGSPVARARPVRVPVVSIYSRTDAIVGWRASRLPDRPTTANIEVHGTHFGLGHNPAVLHAVAEILARPTEDAVAFRPGSFWATWYPAA